MSELPKDELDKAELAKGEPASPESANAVRSPEHEASAAPVEPTHGNFVPEHDKAGANGGTTAADDAVPLEPTATTPESPHESAHGHLGEPELDVGLPLRADPPSDTSGAEGACMVIGLFDNADALMSAIPKAKARQLGQLEAYTPYPIHGIDDALGIRRSPLGAMVMVMGIIGALTALGFQLWVSAVDYPIVTGGKPPWSWEAFVPIMFEVTVLFATFTAGLGMLFLLNKLPFFGHPVLGSKAIASITRDRFALAVEAPSDRHAQFDAPLLEDALRSFGASTVEVVLAPAKEPVFTSQFVLRTLGAIVVSAGVAGVLMYWTIKLFPVLPPMSHMLDQPALKPQKASSFFADRHGMRMPVAGTVARGYLPLGGISQDEAAAMVNPLPRTEQTLLLGKQKYTERCAVCHGALANGKGSLTAAYGATPANLQAAQFRDYTDGQLYWVIVNGKNAMPSQAADLSPDQRWAVVHYVRALQRAQNAKDEDIHQP